MAAPNYFIELAMDLNYTLISFSLELYRSTDKCSLLQHMARTFSESCRRCVCDRLEADCGQCAQVNECSWRRVFSQELSADPAAVRRFQKPSLPFAFSFSSSDSLHKKYDCRLTVFGRAVQHIGLLLAGIESVFRATGRIGQVCSHDFQGTKIPLSRMPAQPDNLSVLSLDTMVDSAVMTAMTVRLKSPLRLYHNGRQLFAFDVQSFIASVLRRTTSIIYYYCGYEFLCDFKDIVRDLDVITCRENSFTIHPARSRGMIGSGCFEGEFSRIAPFVRLGSLVNAGKGSAYGWGEFEVEFK